MDALLFAQAQAPNHWWFDFVDTWGNTASVVGFFLTVVGFAITWVGQAAIRRATRRALERVAFQVLATNVEDLYRLLATAREACRQGEWLRAFDRCQDAKHRTLRLTSNPHLTQEESVSLVSASDDLAHVINYIEVNKLSDNPSATFQQAKKEALDRIIDLLTGIQGRLSNRTWEDSHEA